jgi:uncharacterized membrane protein HdeD (DUF308 family)
MISEKSPGWMRAAQIGLGILAIIVSGAAIVFPGIFLVSTVIVLAIVFIFVGIEKIITGIFIEHKSKWATVGLGVLVIIIASIALAFPVATTIFVIFMLGFALLFDGIARIISGFADKGQRGWSRGFSIGVGVLAIVISMLILASPLFGVELAGFFIGIALIIIGIQMISAGIVGKKLTLPSAGFKRS